jgi:hypothetical protein
MNMTNIPAGNNAAALVASPATGATLSPSGREGMARTPPSAPSAVTPRTPRTRTWSETQSNGNTPSVVDGGASAVRDENGGDGARQGIGNVMDELLVQYLRKRGYHVSTSGDRSDSNSGRGADGDVVMEDVSTRASPLKQEARMINGVKEGHNASSSSPVDVESAGFGRRLRASSDERRKLLGSADDLRINELSVSAAFGNRDVTLEQYAQQLGLNTESCAANHVVRVYMRNASKRNAIDSGFFSLPSVCLVACSFSTG